MMRGLLAVFRLVLAMLVALLAAAAPARAQFVEGRDYIALTTPVRTDDSRRIEVALVTAYACPRCFQLEPLVQRWKQRQASGVYLTRVYASFTPQMEPLARGAATLRVMGLEERLTPAVFNRFQIESAPLTSAESWAAFLASQGGVDAAQARLQYNSMPVTVLVKQMEARVRGYRSTGAPEFIVNGRYRVTTGSAGGLERMVQVVDYLVAREAGKTP